MTESPRPLRRHNLVFIVKPMSDTQLIPTWQLHHRLALALEVSGVTPDQMAAELGVHVNTVHNYASGRRTPKLGLVKQWADACQVNREWLWSGEAITDTDTGRYCDDPTLFDDDLQVSAEIFWHPSLLAA